MLNRMARLSVSQTPTLGSSDTAGPHKVQRFHLCEGEDTTELVRSVFDVKLLHLV